ncbi:uncharacterized protein SCHCODRAFT_02492503 [Schizophyllum commune H4-8]|uniref:Uncharacterized protein n=1 Tax=Schizophyllum commune (strain H4-8 / FGSC 9210) TaxID=578458 RepID=D8PYT6_SCHCM|nr:uncharacterized protein SCHCODRAFT_02492503 [Schizophyllum commune H4-8]KAI5896100.1 hypothetical protein SCHCODRAFT_02492503 [Schizophyllum commune H4-8]
MNDLDFSRGEKGRRIRIRVAHADQGGSADADLGRTRGVSRRLEEDISSTRGGEGSDPGDAPDSGDDAPDSGDDARDLTIAPVPRRSESWMLDWDERRAVLDWEGRRAVLDWDGRRVVLDREGRRVVLDWEGRRAVLDREGRCTVLD